MQNMSSRDQVGSKRPRSRQSIAYVPKSGTTLDKENATTDIGAMKGIAGAGRTITRDKKSRSKSLGPGGLDALQMSSGNRRKSSMALPLKSILKPTIPVSPLRNIPTFDEARRRNESRSPSPRRQRDAPNLPQAEEGMLIDFSTPVKVAATGTEQLDNPFDGFNASSAIRDAKEREEKERKEREKKAILEQREARRKSMANRRVSFAPEATLHTWNVIELGEDSTASSSANSTRRASSLANATNQVLSENPVTSTEEQGAAFSPVQLGEQPRELSSSPFSGSSAGGSDGTQSPVKEVDVDDADSDSEDFDAESTAMSIDDIASHTSGIEQIDDSSTSSSLRLNEALRQAAREAGTASVDVEDDDEVSMEIADQEITGAFKPWIQKGQRISFDMEDISALQDQENVNSFQPPGRHEYSDTADDVEDDYNENEELSMEITNAVGKILGGAPNRLSLSHRISIGEQTNYDEQTMELTKVVGGIEEQHSPAKSDVGSNVNEDEEMTMEFTSVVGGVLSKQGHVVPRSNEDGFASEEPQRSEHVERDFSEWGDGDEDENAGMDMEFTGAVGGILSPILEERTESHDGHTTGMDITAAVGRILPAGLDTSDKTQAKQLMELESDAGQPVSSPFQDQVPQSPPKLSTSHHVASVASETGSPSLASVRSRRTRRDSTSSAANFSPIRQISFDKPRTPTQHLTPQPARPRTPGKTPPSSNITFRSASPKKLFKEEIKASATQSQTPERRKLFEDDANGSSTPAFILRPHPRYSSGLGVDKTGLGSPKVADILDRRRSIGEDAQEFVPQEPSPRRLRFEDPVKLHQEVDREREEEENREAGSSPVLQASDPDATSNLRGLISSLTPKKRKVGNRKSLHVGAAKGLLGKRPIELDDEEEEDESPKRIRAANASPVKPVKLPAPPTKEETVRRVNRSSTGKSSGFSPAKQTSFTPRGQPPRPPSPVKSKSPVQALYRRENAAPDEHLMEGAQFDDESQENVEDDADWEPIRLQDFLNLTNIHFMELTTTKRRHTTVPGNDKTMDVAGSRELEGTNISFEDCVAAGFCTVPMLELYQHSCRELKSYISEGRQIIRSIEEETLAENPPLFREYVTARPDIRLLMDNQFRNVKTHARLLSKAMWYEWRMKLLEGLKEGLNRHVEEMKADDALISQQESILQSIVPELVERRSMLNSEATKLQEIVDEMESCDPEELRMARERLANVDAEIARKRKQLELMQEDLQDKTDTIEAGTELKTEFMAQIREAERVREECRGWSIKEVNALKDSVRVLEAQTGWSIASAMGELEPTGPGLTLRYKEELEVKFYPKLFKSATASDEAQGLAPFELAYSPRKAGQSLPIPPAKSVILSHMRTAVKSIPSSASIKQIFQFMSDAWDLTYQYEEEVRILNFYGVTKTALMGNTDAALTSRARCILVGTIDAGQEARRARIDVDFCVTPRVDRTKREGSEDIVEKLQLYTEVAVSKVYGFPEDGSRKKVLSDSQMRDVILRKLGSKSKGTDTSFGLTVNLGQGSWGRSAQELALKVFS